MLTSTFFGHRDEDYFPYGEKIEAIVKSLIEDCGCIQFYSGYRGEFEKFSAYIVFRLKEKYPYIRNTMILSYSRQLKVSFPALFDDAVYLLGESKVPPQYAILGLIRNLWIYRIISFRESIMTVAEHLLLAAMREKKES